MADFTPFRLEDMCPWTCSKHDNDPNEFNVHCDGSRSSHRSQDERFELMDYDEMREEDELEHCKVLVPQDGCADW